jgi:hypothetical protein
VFSLSYIRKAKSARRCISYLTIEHRGDIAGVSSDTVAVGDTIPNGRLQMTAAA